MREVNRNEAKGKKRSPQRSPISHRRPPSVFLSKKRREPPGSCFGFRLSEKYFRVSSRVRVWDLVLLALFPCSSRRVRWSVVFGAEEDRIRPIRTRHACVWERNVSHDLGFSTRGSSTKEEIYTSALAPFCADYYYIYFVYFRAVFFWIFGFIAIQSRVTFNDRTK